jgi:pimeloyl-ACP methyl ester carboxylesterase
MRKKLWIGLAIVVILLLVVYLAIGWYFANIAIAPPARSLEDAQAQTGTPADYGLPEPEVITIDAGEVTLSGWYFDNPVDANCGVMFMHGFTGTRYEALYWAPLFWSRGCDLLAYDHRGHGESTPALLSYGYFEKQEALVARDWFVQRSGLSASRIAVGGVSYGAATALQLAPQIPEAPFVLADSSYSSISAILGHRANELLGPVLGRFLTPGALWVAGLRAGFDPAAVSPETAVAEAQMPVLLIHSRTDNFTPYTHSEAIYANSDPTRTVLHINDWGSLHAADIVTDFLAYQALFEAFLAQYAPDFGLPTD